MSTTEKKALLIAYWFPPMSVHTWRSWHVYLELKKKFSAVTILTTSHRKYLSELDLQGAHQEVLAIPTLDYRSLYFLRKKSTSHVAERKKNRLAFWFYNLLNSFPFNLLVGEGGAVYLFLGWRAALKTAKDGEVSFLFSSFRPYADHCIAWLVKRSHPEIFWVADFRDLHLDPVLNEFFFPRFQKWCTRKILAKADVVTTVSKGLAEHLKPFHPNVVVLRNGIGGSAPVANSKLPTANRFTITYTGSMFRELRKPDLLLEALAELIAEQKMVADKIQIRYAGKDTATWLPLLDKFGLTNVFHSLGNVSHEEALNLQLSSHVNLLLTYATTELKGNATGKLYEYLAASQPVLLLVNGCRDEELEEIFEETGAGLIAYNSLNEKGLVKDFLLLKYNEWLTTGQVAPAIEEAALDAFRWENMMKGFLEKHVFETGPAKKTSGDFQFTSQNP